MKKRILLVEGGAMRGIFSIGVLDTLIQENMYDFDRYIGVSAGATCLASYLAGMYQRNYRVTVDYSTRKDFIGFSKVLRGRDYMDLDWLWDYCEEHDPLDVEAVLNRTSELYIGVTSAETGDVEYIQLNKENAFNLLKASCAIPVIYKKPVNVEGRLFFDGGVANPIPIDKAIEMGADEIVVIRSRKKDFILEHKESRVKDYLLRKYPKIRDAFKKRAQRYNKSVEIIRQEHEGVKIIEINPNDEFKTTRFTMDKDILDRDYKMGREMGLELVEMLRKVEEL